MLLKKIPQGLAFVALIGSTALSTPSVVADEDWRAQNPVFRIGIANDNSSPRTSAQYEGFRQVVEAAIDMPVEVFVAPNLASLIDAYASGRVDYAPMTLLGYYTADKICDCAEPLVAPTTADGATAIRSVLLTKTVGGATLDGLVNKSVAIGPDISVAGDMVPRVEFQFNGKPLGEADLTLVQAASFEDTLDKLTNDDVSAAFGWAYADTNSAAVFEDGLAARAINAYDMALTPLWQSVPIPLGPHLIARDVPENIKRAMRGAMLSLHTDHPLAFDEISPQLSGPMRPINAFSYRGVLDIIDQAQL